ncbi:hypothetical protein GCM10009682_47290 [Luedemannella flava]|uniref:Uncharacterized protein n=1 Tax=Luedemannella flava TaxID=349316 RepID=A0ABP4YSQ2_9ACTN
MNTTTPTRCAAAHPHDSTPCNGPADAVRVVSAYGEQVHGCVYHGAILLASLESARVYPGSVPGAAIDAFNRAAHLPPFAFRTGTRHTPGRAA